MLEASQNTPKIGNDDFYRRMFDTAAVAMVATDERFNIVSWNIAAQELLGAPAQEMLGRRIDQAVPEERRKLLMRLVRRTAQRGKTSQFEVRLPDIDGHVRDLMAVLSPVTTELGENLGVAAWIIDHTHSKRLSERLTQTEKLSSLGTLAGGVAHHFNNILGGVATFVDFALANNDAASMRRALQMTAEAASRAAKITQSLLSFAEQDAHRTDLADLTEVVLTFAHLVERPLAERKINLLLDLKAVPILAVEANRMHQALGNLLTNSEEAMPDGGQVHIALECIGEEVCLMFRDSGCGVKPEHLSLLFEPFFTTKGLLAGGDRANPGLGLSVVHGIITEMGGRIEVASDYGSNTTFSIFFPLHPAE